VSISQAAVGGIKWTAISHVVTKAVSFATSVLLVRYLAPSDFGLFAMVVVVTGFLDMFSDLGTAAAVIQRTTTSTRLLCSIFWTNVAFGLAIATFVFLAAPFAAAFYGESRVEPLMRFLAITFLIAGFRTLPQALLQKSLAFETIAKLEMINAAISTTVVIFAAILGEGVWSLAYQSVVSVTFLTVGFWLAQSFRPQLAFDWTELKSVFHYSLSLTGFNVFNYFARNADTVLIGRFLGAQQLGYYDLAYKLMAYPLQAIWAVLGRVMFPVYSAMQNDDVRFRSVYLNVASSIAFVAFPVMFGILVAARPFVLSVFGTKWEPMVPVLEILAAVGAFQSIGTTVGSIYQAKGRTDWMLAWGIASGLLIVLAFVVGLRWGIVGIAASYAAMTLLLIYPSFAIPFRLIKLPFRKLVLAIWRPAAASVLMVVAVASTRYLVGPAAEPRVVLLVLVTVGAAVYGIATLWFNRDQVRELVTTLRFRS